MLVRFGERILFAYVAGEERVALMLGTDLVRELSLDEACLHVVALAPSIADRTVMLDAGVRVEAGGVLVRIARGFPTSPPAAFPARRAA
jgi:hypothetical protein